VRLKDKIALVTGAASGMGESAAQVFAREGAKVVVADLLEKEGSAVAASIASAGGEAMFLRLDVSGEEQWREAVRATVKRYGRLDVLVNNAGIQFVSRSSTCRRSPVLSDRNSCTWATTARRPRSA